MWATRPLLRFLGAHPPDPLPGGFAPWTPPQFAHPRWLGVSRRFGSPRGGFVNVGNSPPFEVFGGTSPKPPAMGAPPPGPPSLPTPVGWGLAGVLGPPRGGFVNVGNSPPFKVLGGTSPRPPARGLRPLDPQFCPPPLAGGWPAFWVPLVAGLLMWATRPLLRFLGAHPPSPLPGVFAPWTPQFAHPRWLGVCQRFGSLSPGPSPRRRGENPGRERGQGVFGKAHPPTPWTPRLTSSAFAIIIMPAGTDPP